MAVPLCAITLIIIVIFFVTSADSGMLVMNSIASGGRANPPRWQQVFWGILLSVISMTLLSVGGIRSLQTMTLISALPFGIIMLVLCGCLYKALQNDELYRTAKVPYGSRTWDGRFWRERLSQILTFSQRQDIVRFLNEKVRPVFEELQAELAKNDIDAHIIEGKQGRLSIELTIPHDQIWNFRYGVSAEKHAVSDYLVDDDNTPDVRNNVQYIPVTYYSDGRTGNDIQYLTRDEIIADVLREYERYLSIIADERKSMMFVDKGNIIQYMKK